MTSSAGTLSLSTSLFERVRLLGYWRSSSAWRVRIALSLKGLDYDNVAVNIAPKVSAQHAPEFREKNALGQVPVLEFVGGVLDGKRLTQSVAIIELLDELVPSPSLLPKDPWAKSQTRMLTEIVNAGTQPLGNLGVQKQIRDLGGDVDAWLKQVMGAGFAALEIAASGSAGRFLVGDDVSMADCFLVPQLYNARRFNVPLQAYPTLLAVEARCLEVAAFVDSHPDRMPDAVSPAP